MARETVRGGVAVDGIKAARAVLRTLDKDAKKAATDAANAIAAREALRIAAAARTSSRQGRLVAGSVRARRGQVPTIAAGGSVPVRKGVQAGDIFFGAEFGGGRRATTRQFRRHLGTEGYFFYPTLRDDAPAMTQEWLTALDGIARAWAS